MTGDEESTAPQGSAGDLIVHNLTARIEKTTTGTPGILQTPSDHPVLSPFGQYSVFTTREETTIATAVIIAE